MNRTKSEARRQAEFEAAAEGMYVRLREWRAAHPEASFDEIGEQVTQERQRLMAQLLGELAAQPEECWGGRGGVCGLRAGDAAQGQTGAGGEPPGGGSAAGAGVSPL